MLTNPATQNYIDILEKTNQQLSLWYNPYGILIGILAIIITLLAILFAYILWKQGKEYRDIFNDFLNNQRKIADGELKKAINETQDILDEQIKNHTSKLKDLNGKAKEDIEKEIIKLKKTRESLEKSPLSFDPVTSSALFRSNKLLNLSDLKIPLYSTAATELAGLSFNRCLACNNHTPIGALYCPKCGIKM